MKNTDWKLKFELYKMIVLNKLIFNALFLYNITILHIIQETDA